MVLVTRQGSNPALNELQNSVDELNTKFENYVKNTDNFRRKLEAEVSKIRETNYEIADRLDILLKEWGEI
jgi:molecular chaperone GrpE (heat shock protein)